jgi:hypothetical protein
MGNLPSTEDHPIGNDIDFLRFFVLLSGLHPSSGFVTDIEFLLFLGSLSGLHPPSGFANNTTHHSQVNSKRMGNHYRTYNRTILPTPSQDQQERYPRQNHSIPRQQEDQGHWLILSHLYS